MRHLRVPAADVLLKVQLLMSGESGSDVVSNDLCEPVRRAPRHRTDRTVDHPDYECDVDAEDQREEHHESDANAPVEAPIPARRYPFIRGWFVHYGAAAS